MINDHPIDNLMKNTMESLKSMVDVNTVIGDTIVTSDGASIIPISKVSLGFAAGGSEFSTKSSEKSTSSAYPFGGGTGAGISVKPVGFLFVRNGSIRYLPVEENSTYDKIIDTVPQLFDMVKDLFNRSSCSCDDNYEEDDESSCSCNFHSDDN